MGVFRGSTSPYASPVAIVRKKDGSNHVCVDYRKLNKITVFDPEPMGSADEIFHKLRKDKYFSKIDLSKGYWQVPVAETDIAKTAFVTPDGSYEFLKMAFGMMNPGATLVRGMKKLLYGMHNVDSIVDDILVHTTTLSEHVCLLKDLFQRLQRANLTARPSKCVIGSNTIDFVGHQIGQSVIVGLHEGNVTKIRDAPRPRTKKEIRSFLGLMGFYRSYLPNHAAIAVPLSDITRKGLPNVIVWGDAQEKAYTTLKHLLTSQPVLKLPDPDRLYILRTDASDAGIGAILLQEHDGTLYPVSFTSKKLTDREKNYSIMEKECLAVVCGVRRFMLYLYGQEFVLQTDLEPLLYINKAKLLNGRIMRWAMFLQNYKIKIE